MVSDLEFTEAFFSFPNSPPKIIRSFMGTIEEANVYLESGFYLALTGFLCKVSPSPDC